MTLYNPWSYFQAKKGVIKAPTPGKRICPPSSLVLPADPAALRADKEVETGAFAYELIDRFHELRGLQLNKSPSLGELLMWLAVLAAKGYDDATELARCAPRDLPALNTLVKDEGDLSGLG